jgi:hypothetical protein
MAIIFYNNKVIIVIENNGHEILRMSNKILNRTGMPMLLIEGFRQQFAVFNYPKTSLLV